MAKYQALDIANFYVQLANSLPDSSVSNAKLNKLCYYAQAWSLVKLGYPLFDEDIQAWDYGPIIPSVYHTYKVCGKNPIEEAADLFDESRLSSEELSLLTDVYICYGKYTASALIGMTQKTGGPWDEYFIERANITIPKEIMRDYFAKSDELQTMQLNITDENVVSYV